MICNMGYTRNINDPFELLQRAIEYRFGKEKQKEASIEDKFNQFKKAIDKKLAQLEKEGKIKAEIKDDGTKVYYSVEETSELKEQPKDEPKEEVTEDKPNFVMTKEEFAKFIAQYKELENAFSKMKYIFGVDANANGAKFSFYDKFNEIIWDLIKAIFGEDNLEDICAYCFGNSNFDSAEQLYDELT